MEEPVLTETAPASSAPTAVDFFHKPLPEAIIALKQKHALRSHADVLTEILLASNYVIENVFLEKQLGMVLGNSGLGKSPALYQLSICAAAGIPFLGERTVETDVLYLDFENGAAASREIAERIANFLGLQPIPNNFLRWNADDCGPQFGRPGHGIEEILRDWSLATTGSGRPKLAIIDPLRFWLTEMENPRLSDGEIQKARKVIRETGVGILGVHHVRRVSGEIASHIPLLETDPRSWVLGMSRGAQAFINGSDVRLGFERAANPVAHDKGGLVLAGFRRMRGQIGPIYLERVISHDDDEPLGFRRFTSIELLGNSDHVAAFQKFPDRFPFTEAQQIFGKSDSATANLLKKCRSLNLLQKEVGKNGQYVKTKL
jgi:hypothetical protein